MVYQIKQAEEFVTEMINFITAQNEEITDFNDGSIINTIIEAVGYEMEEISFSTFLGIKEGSLESVFKAFGFPRRPAQASVGAVTFSRATPATADIPIPKGTTVATSSTGNFDAVDFTTIDNSILLNGQTQIDVQVRCNDIGTKGNVPANTITVINTPIAGIESVTNTNTFVTGAEIETAENRAKRFYNWLKSLSKGTKEALESAVLDSSQEIVSVKAVDSPPPTVAIYNTNTDAWSDESFEAQLLGGVPFEMLPNPEHIGDIFYLGSPDVFDNINFSFGLGGNTGTSTYLWEYLNQNGVWTAINIEIDGTNQLNQSGTIQFTQPNDWLPMTITQLNLVEPLFYVRLRIINTGFTTIPQINHITLPPGLGVVDIYAHDSTGNLTTSAQASAQASAESTKAQGIRVNVLAPQIVNINMEVRLVIDEDYNQTEIQQIVHDRITEYLNAKRLGEDVTRAEIYQAVMNIFDEGVILNANIITPIYDRVIAGKQLARAGSILVTSV